MSLQSFTAFVADFPPAAPIHNVRTAYASEIWHNDKNISQNQAQKDSRVYRNWKEP